MPTKKKRHYCIKCGRRKVASKTIRVECVRIRYGIQDGFQIYFCTDCAIRFQYFLNSIALDVPKSGALGDTPKKTESVQMVATPSNP